MFSLKCITRTLNSLFKKQQQNSFGSDPIWILALICLELHLPTVENTVQILFTRLPIFFLRLSSWIWRIGQVLLECLPSLVSLFWLKNILPVPLLCYLYFIAASYPLNSKSQNTNLHVRLIFQMDNFYFVRKHKNNPSIENDF